MAGRALAGKRTLVTGAASGIGQATALRLLDEGAAAVGADLLGGLDAVVDAAGILRAAHTHQTSLE